MCSCRRPPAQQAPSHACWLQGEDYLSRWRQTAVRLQHIASAAAGAARREPSPDRMRAAVIASDTAVRLQLAQETRCLRW